jgi:hypothetical protein
VWSRWRQVDEMPHNPGTTYINDYGQPWTSSDANPIISLLHGQIASPPREAARDYGDKWSAATFPQSISIHVVVPAARAPIGVAMRWRKRHPCPRHHDEHSGQDEGTGQEQGRAPKKSVPSTCPTEETLTGF